MKTRLITSLALPAAMATAGLLNTAETAFADSHVVGKKDQGGIHDKATYGHGHHCPPTNNVTWFDYGHGQCHHNGEKPRFHHGHGKHCPPTNNVTWFDYGHHCPPVANSTFFDFAQPVLSTVSAEINFARNVLESVI